MSQSKTHEGNKNDKSLSNLKEYLEYYLSCKKPGYAVLVTGEWGVGKTFQVQEILSKESGYWISLFGINDPQDIIASIYASMFPGKNFVKKLFDGVSTTDIDLGFLSIPIGGVTSKIANAFLRQEVNTDKPIIIDDLERSKISIQEVLGVVNLYVEHHGCHVVVLAHDDELEKEFKRAKEKIFGHVIKISPKINTAFEHFISLIEDEEQRDFLVKYRDTIVDIFLESGAQSLRIMKHIIADLGRLVKKMEKKHKGNDLAMVELVRLFSAFNIEWRIGGLDPSDIKNRQSKELTYLVKIQKNDANTIVPPWIILVKQRYTSVDLSSNLLQDDVLFQILVEGRFDEGTICNSLDSSPHFLDLYSTPWKVIWNFRDLDNQIVAEAAEKMEQQFVNREIIDLGEMLHVFSLRMMMSQEKIIKTDIGQVIRECKLYIDDIAKSGKLSTEHIESDWYLTIESGAYGLGYQIGVNKSEFEGLFNYLLEARRKAFDKELPELASRLLNLLETNGSEFCQQISYTYKGSSQYGLTPILAHISPEKFVDTWMRSPVANWREISLALKMRYRDDKMDKLKSEKSWVNDVINLLQERANSATGFEKSRILYFTPDPV